MPSQQVLLCVMPGRQMLRTTDLPESSCLDECTQDGGAVGCCGSVDGCLEWMMRISILKMGQWSEDDGGFWLLKRVHVAHALGLLHRLLVLIHYVDGSATTPVYIWGESTRHFRVCRCE